MKKILFFIFFLFIILINNALSSNLVNKITFIDRDDYKRLVFYLTDIPQYSMNTQNDLELELINTKIEGDTFVNFEKEYDFKKINLVGTEKSIKFKIDTDSKFKRHLFIKPNEYTKEYRLIVDFEKEKLNEKKIDDFIFEKVISGNENKNKTLNDTIDLVLNNKNNERDNLDDLLNEIIELKILETEIKKEKAKDLDDIIEKSIVKASTGETKIAKQKRETKTTKKLIKKTNFVIVIDAGHGGKDPGAIGVKKTREKDINLQYALALRDELRRNKKVKVYLVRDKDIYYSLTERLRIARKYKPDLFISLHSDSATNKKARGLSIYTLSKKASDTRTAKLARSENKTNIIAGMNLYSEYQDTINTLVDLSRKEVLNQASIFVDMAIKDFDRNRINMIQQPHRYGNFAVLLAPDFPSILIELGFLSNTKDEKMLKSKSYKKDFVKSINETINKFFNKQ